MTGMAPACAGAETADRDTEALVGVKQLDGRAGTDAGSTTCGRRWHGPRFDGPWVIRGSMSRGLADRESLDDAKGVDGIAARAEREDRARRPDE